MDLLSYVYGGGAGVMEEGVCGRQWCIPSLHGLGDLSVVNFGSCALSYRRCGGAHCPLIEEIAPDQDEELDLVPCGPSLLEINSNILPLDLHGSILNSKLETKTRMNIHFPTD
jgi:hypothetical protein